MSTSYTIQGEGLYRVFGEGWWVDIEYRWNKATDLWEVAILDSSRFNGSFVSVGDMALAANEVIGMGEVPPEKLVWADTGERIKQ